MNDEPTWFESHPVGSDWSRTPYVAEVLRRTDANGQPIGSSTRSLLGLLKSGENTLSFRRSTGLYHIHDIAIRIYFDPAAPLLNANTNQPLQVPDGELLSVQADNGAVSASAGGVLAVNSNQLLLRANVTTAAKFAEFHGYYRGYDLDNDDSDGDRRGFDTEWHNRGRNNWHPGGTDFGPQGRLLGGTIDHIGTVETPVTGEYPITWNLPHIPNQSGVKFKLRIVSQDSDNNYVVREAAGGVSAAFTLQRSARVIAIDQPNWQDFVLHHDGRYPDVVAADVFLPCDIDPGDYNSAYVLGSYWRTPELALNGNSSFRVFTGDEDNWTLSVRDVSSSQLQAGNNIFHTFILPVLASLSKNRVRL